MSINLQRKNELVKATLSQILLKANDLILQQVSIVSVKLSKNSASASVVYTFSQLQDKPLTINKVQAKLMQASGFFRSQLAQRLDFWKAPSLTFIYDKGLDHATKIDSILAELNKDSSHFDR